jgi:hypothetical protein
LSTDANTVDAAPASAVAVVAHDAGGAEVLSSYVRQRGLHCRLALEGPACAVFERKLGAYQNLAVEDALHGSTRLLCGTSWQSDLELKAIRLARAKGKPSVAWLDHWVQYRQRFERGGGLCLPDEVWVSDRDALALENPYFADIRTELAKASRVYGALPGRLTILYACEPVREAALRQFGDALHWGYTEEQALRYFLDNLGVLGAPVGRIVIRPHPSETAGKYADIVTEYALPVRFSDGSPLSAEVASSDCVVGCGSMAMVIGLIARKRVISCIPPGGAPCPLPQPEIEWLQNLVRLCA